MLLLFIVVFSEFNSISKAEISELIETKTKMMGTEIELIKSKTELLEAKTKLLEAKSLSEAEIIKLIKSNSVGSGKLIDCPVGNSEGIKYSNQEYTWVGYPILGYFRVQVPKNLCKTSSSSFKLARKFSSKLGT